MNCEYIEKCPIFGKSKSGVLDKIFMIKYCQGSKLDECVRKKLKGEGQNVPENLLPNGEYYSFK